jgi:ketol-acid reductoisomerase
VLTKRQQQLLLELLFYKRLLGRDIYKKGIFSTESDQSKQIKELRNFNYIKVDKNKKKKNEKVYTLTKFGKFFSLWLARQENGEHRFRQISKREWGQQFWVNAEGRVIWFQ